MRLVRFLASTTATSLLDQQRGDLARPGQSGNQRPATAGRSSSTPAARSKTSSTATGWEAEFPRDIWQLRRLGYDGNQTLDFTAVSQPWLCDLGQAVAALAPPDRVEPRDRPAGAAFIDPLRASFATASGSSSLADIDRAVLERYLADLQAEWGGRQRHNDHIAQLNSFLCAIRQHRWDDSLSPSALIFSDDYPKRNERVPRALSEQVMAQIEQPDNLDRWDNPAFRLVTVILIRCGLRVNDALRLQRRVHRDRCRRCPLPALRQSQDEARSAGPDRRRGPRSQSASSGAGRCRTMPVPAADEEPRWAAPESARAPTGKRSTGGWSVVTYATTHGQPVHLTPHQWRHTLGTRLLNRDVPQEVVRRILDHDSPQMTAHYARLHDTTVRRHWEAARKVDITGETCAIDPDGPLAEAAWAKQRLGRATQALPNGFCGLPVQKACPHANACLTCPMFLTTVEFLPQHRQQRTQVVKIITAAEAETRPPGGDEPPGPLQPGPDHHQPRRR